MWLSQLRPLLTVLNYLSDEKPQRAFGKISFKKLYYRNNVISQYEVAKKPHIQSFSLKKPINAKFVLPQYPKFLKIELYKNTKTFAPTSVM